MEETRITSVNFDCLERIFHLLDLESLCSVAETCTHLKTAAERVFSRNFAKSREALERILYSITNGPKWQRLLKNFSHLIQSVSFFEPFLLDSATALEENEQHMHMLKVVSFDTVSSNQLSHVKLIKKILSFCPYIERFGLMDSGSKAESGISEFLIELSEKLETFIWQRSTVSCDSEFVDIMSNFKNLKMLKIPLDTTYATRLLNSLAANDVPIEMLSLTCRLDDDLIGAISRLKVKKFAYQRHDNRGYDNKPLLRLAQALPHLTELAVVHGSGPVGLLQTFIPCAQNLSQFSFEPIKNKFKMNTGQFERLVNAIKRRPSGIKLKINCSDYWLRMNVQPDILQSNSNHIEIEYRFDYSFGYYQCLSEK